MLAYSQSLSVDRRLLPYDVRASKAHVRMLGRQGIIPAADAAAIEAALDQVVLDEDATDEDVHSLIERQLVAPPRRDRQARPRRPLAQRPGGDRVPPVRPSTRRAGWSPPWPVSRLCWWPGRDVDGDLVLPGYTHLQRAQPLPLGHHLAAHAWALQRDVTRLRAALFGFNEMKAQQFADRRIWHCAVDNAF